MKTKQQILAQKLARLDTLKSQQRSMLAEYMPIKYEIIELEDEIEALELEQMEVDSAEGDKRFDEIIANINEPAVKNGYIGELEGVVNLSNEELQLIDEIKNPEDYANFDLKDLESSQ